MPLLYSLYPDLKTLKVHLFSIQSQNVRRAKDVDDNDDRQNSEITDRQTFLRIVVLIYDPFGSRTFFPEVAKILGT